MSECKNDPSGSCLDCKGFDNLTEVDALEYAIEAIKSRTQYLVPRHCHDVLLEKIEHMYLKKKNFNL